MKTKKESNTPAVRNKYTAQFKEQVLERADRDGIRNNPGASDLNRCFGVSEKSPVEIPLR